VGYNPFRARVKHQGDVLIVAAALLVVAALLAWAFFG
jgi:Tfp pilus assembly protein PilX